MRATKKENLIHLQISGVGYLLRLSWLLSGFNHRFVFSSSAAFMQVEFFWNRIIYATHKAPIMILHCVNNPKKTRLPNFRKINDITVSRWSINRNLAANWLFSVVLKEVHSWIKMHKIFYFPLKITIIIWDTEVHFIMYQDFASGPPFFRVMPKTRLAFSKFCFENHFIDPLNPRPPHGEFIATLTFNCGRNLVVSPFKWNLFRKTFVPCNINNWSRDYVMRID